MLVRASDITVRFGGEGDSEGLRTLQSGPRLFVSQLRCRSTLFEAVRASLPFGGHLHYTSCRPHAADALARTPLFVKLTFVSQNECL